MTEQTSRSHTVSVNGTVLQSAPGTTIAAIIAAAGISFARRSVTGEERAALCGMGICFECRVTVNGRAHVRSCQTVCQPGMVIVTAGYPVDAKQGETGD